jgi:hypothetical protein
MSLYTLTGGKMNKVEPITFEAKKVYYYGSTIPASVIYITRIIEDTIYYIKLVDQLYHCADNREFSGSKMHVSASVQSGVSNMSKELDNNQKDSRNNFYTESIQRVLNHDHSGYTIPTDILTVEVQREKQRLEAIEQAKKPPVKRIDIVDVAKIVRGKLKERFPGQKFSVRSSRYSGGSSIDVSWVDGPTTKQINALIGHYKGASFDGMIDLKSYHNSTDETGAEVHYSNDYIFAQRELSKESKLYAWELACKNWNLDSALAYWEDSKWGGQLKFTSFERLHGGNDTAQDYWRKELNKISFWKPPTDTPENKPTLDTTNGVQFTEYKGKPIIKLPYGKKGFSFGVTKAKAILEHMKEIEQFITDNK